MAEPVNNPPIERDIAVRIDSLLLGVMYTLESVQQYIKSNVPRDDYDAYRYKIAHALGELLEISWDLHAIHPDIVRKEMKGTRESNYPRIERRSK
jgi:hypothetical protein